MRAMGVCVPGQDHPHGMDLAEHLLPVLLRQAGGLSEVLALVQPGPQERDQVIHPPIITRDGERTC